MTGRKLPGFTLIELLVVIAIVALLSSVVLASLNSSRDKAKVATAKAQLSQIRKAVAQLESDTGKSLRGCDSGPISGASNEISLADPQIGLFTAPTDFTTFAAICRWTSSEAGAWKGPYISPTKDPWGKEYWFDSDYSPRANCGATAVPIVPVVVSGGPNGVNGAETPSSYDCDDIYVVL
jgi:prepilin-type N-terminal cleavage/methylation domain-containing protein